jgi:hypothetical protein
MLFAARRSLATMLCCVCITACNNTSPTSAAQAEPHELQAAGRRAAAQALAVRAVSLPVLNATVFDGMNELVPGLAAHRRAAEELERGAIEHVLAKFARREGMAKPPSVVLLSPQSMPAHSGVASAAAFMLDWLVAPAHAQGLDWPTLQAAAVGSIFTTLMGDIGDAGKLPAGKEASRADYSGKSGADASIVVSGDDNGSPTVSLTTKVDVPIFLLEANSKLTLNTAGLCPDAAGKVEFTIKLGQGGRAGSGSSVIYDRNREAKVIAFTNDQAEIANAEIQTQYAERSTANNRQVYAEAATSWHMDGGNLKDLTMTKSELVRASSQTNSTDNKMLADGAIQSMLMGAMALQSAKDRWQKGACIKINAKSPGNVRRKQTSTIPVSVMHRNEGKEVGAKLMVKLSGGESVEPELISHSPGTLTHVAPDQRHADMQIELEAISIRGKATETLKLSINADQFWMEGGADEFHGEGQVCNLSQPWQIKGIGVVVKFVPDSAQGGSYSYDGNMSGFPVFGHGAYTVTYDGEVAVAITASGPGSVKTPMGTQTRNGTEKYMLEPRENAYCY